MLLELTEKVLYAIFCITYIKKAGYKVGLFTSPHLIDFRERIVVGEDLISKEYIVDFSIKILKDLEK